MEILFSRFSYIADEVFVQLNYKSLKACREVSKSWQKYIDYKKFCWIRIVNVPKIIEENDKYFYLALRSGQSIVFGLILEKHKSQIIKMVLKSIWPQACHYGYLKIVVIILNKFFELKIDLKDLDPRDVLATACGNGYYQIVKILLKKFEEQKIDFEELTPKRLLKLACEYGYFKIVEMLLNKFAELKIDLNNLNDFGLRLGRYKVGKCSNTVQSKMSLSETYGFRTAFQIVCLRGHSKLAEMLILKSTGLIFSQRFFLKAHTLHISSLIEIFYQKQFLDQSIST